MNRIRTARVVLALAGMTLVAAACSGGSDGTAATPGPRPSSTAKLAFVSPTNGQLFQGAPATVPVELTLEGARVVPATTRDITPDTGHVHIFLDNQIVTMNFGLTDELPNVPAGTHILRAEFVAADHLPFDPRVFTAVTFKVEP
jgi:hypothetical protein